MMDRRTIDLAEVASGARIKVRDTLWQVKRVTDAQPGKLIEAIGISGIATGKDAIFVSRLEPDLAVVDPADVELIADQSPGFNDTRLYLEAAFRTAAPTGVVPLVTGKAAIDELPFQNVPVERALKQGRVRLLIADDVGLGKTLEAGLVAAELILRRRARRILVVANNAALAQFQKEFWIRFSIPLTRLDSDRIQRIRNTIPSNHNPFEQYDKTIVSIDTLKNDIQYRTAIEQTHWDLIIIDEGHNVAERRNSAGGSSMRSKLAFLLAKRSDAMLILTATPHDGSQRSFSSLISMLDPTAVANPDQVSREEVEPLVVRRFRTTEEVARDLKSKIPPRQMNRHEFNLSAAEEYVYQLVADLRLDVDDGATRGKGTELFRTTIAKALFSSTAACIETVEGRIKRIENGQSKGTEHDVQQLSELLAALRAVGTSGFTKYHELLKALRHENWTGKDRKDRVIVFSERIATLRWLQERLQLDLNLGEGAVVTIDGSSALTDIETQAIIEDFGQEKSKIRVLLASDMASESLNLHFQAHRLKHFDLPWALLTFQQRNGRIDRYGQQHQPLIGYFVGLSQQEKVRDMWVLDVLIEKDKRAQEGIDDPSVFFGTNDAVEQEQITTDAFERGIGAEAFSAELDERAELGGADEFAELDAMFADIIAQPVDTKPFLPPTSVTGPRTFATTFDFAAAMLQRLQVDEGLKLAVDEGDRVIELAVPDDFRERSAFGFGSSGRIDPRWMPEEAVPRNGVIKLTDKKDVIDQAIVAARMSDRSWPNTQFLWDVHPIMDWLGDHAAGLFGRSKVPYCRLPEGRLRKGEVAVLLHGVVTNLRGAPIVDRWAVVSSLQGTSSLEEVSSFLQRSGLLNQTANHGATAPTALGDIVSAAVDKFQWEVCRVRDEAQQYLDDAAQVTMERIDKVRDKHHRQLELAFPGELDARTEGKRARRKSKVDQMFAEFWDWYDETRQMPKDPNPFVDVVAVFEAE